MSIRFTDDTPLVIGNSISVRLAFGGGVGTAECELFRRASRVQVVNCEYNQRLHVKKCPNLCEGTSGSAEFTSSRRQFHQVRVRVTSPANSSVVETRDMLLG